jgi:hypothetical protein
MDDDIISAQLLVQRRSNGGPQIVWAWPVGRAVDRATVAQDNRGVYSLRGRFELSLHIENRSLRRAQDVSLSRARKSTAEHDTRRFVQDVNVFAEMLADQFEDRRLSCTGTTGQHDARVRVRFSALAGERHG